MTLTATELAGMRADALAALFDTARIRRETPGGWVDVTTSVDARLRLATTRAQQAMTDATENAEAAAVCSFPAGTDVRRRDRVHVRGRVMTVDVVQPDSMVHVQAFGRLQAVEVAS